MPEFQPLSLLRQYNIDKTKIVESNGDIILGESSWSKNICTNFLKFGTAKVGTPAEYYTLESLLFFLKSAYLPHSTSNGALTVQAAILELQNEVNMYSHGTSAKNIPIVHELDRRDLLAYLNGEKDCCPSIDGCAPLEIPSQQSDTLSLQLLEEKPTAQLAPEGAPSNLDSTKSEVPAIKTEVIVDCHNDLDIPPDHVNRTKEIIELQKHCRSEIAIFQSIIEMGINSISAEIVEIARENVRNVNHLMVSVANRFDELISNIIDGKTNFKDEELVAISSIQFLYERLTKLRICYKTLDCSTKNFEKELVEHFGSAVIASAVSVSSKFDSADVINTTMKLRDKSIESVGLSGSSKSEGSNTLDTLADEHHGSDKFAGLSIESCESNPANNRDMSPEEDVDQTEEPKAPLVSSKCNAADVFDPFAEEDHCLEKVVNPVTELNECDSSDDSDSPPEDWMELDRWSKSSESGESEPPEDLGEFNLSDKITCICIICDKQIDLPAEMDVSSAMEAHLQLLHPSRSAPLNYATDSEEETSSGSESAEVDVVLPENFEVTFNRENALKYIRLSNGIYLNKQEKYICFVCGSYMPLEKHLGYHMKSKLHCKNVREYAQCSEAAKKNHLVAVDPEIFAIHSGRLYCMECEYFLLNTHNFLSHVSEEHSQKLKLDFPIVKVGNCEFCALCDVKIKKNKSPEIHVASKLHYRNYLQVATVVQLNNIKYCSLCSVKLFTKSQFNSHVDDDCHILNLGTIQNMISHLKFPSKR